MAVETEELELLRRSWLRIAQSANDSLSLYDSELNLIEVNEAGLAMFPEGTERDQVIGRNLTELVPDLIQRGDYHRSKEVLATGEPLMVRDTGTPKEFGEDRRLDLKVLRVGGYLGMVATDVTHRKEHETDLRASQEVLEELNTALKVLLQQREADKEELGAGVLANVRELVLPHLERLRQSRLNQTQRADLDLLEESLNNLISPFMNRLNHRYLDLTPSEVMVADLVRQGWTSKEIAGITNSSLRAVEFHRSNLRKKLGLRHTRTNLRTFLLSLEE